MAPEQPAVAGDRRQVADLDRGVRVLDGGGQHLDHVAHDVVEVDRLERSLRAADPRERQQVVDEVLHPLGAVDRVVDVLVGPLVELVGVALLQQLAEARHLAQRLLQVVGGDVGELLEVGVGPGQVVGLPGQVGRTPR